MKNMKKVDKTIFFKNIPRTISSKIAQYVLESCNKWLRLVARFNIIVSLNIIFVAQVQQSYDFVYLSTALWLSSQRLQN